MTRPPASSRTPQWRALVVEPDAPTRAQLVALIGAVATKLGRPLVVDEAHDGTTALAIWSERHPTLVVSEIVLEGLSGLALLRRIRAESPADGAQAAGPTVALGRKHVPSPASTSVVLVSSMARDSDRYWGLRQGAAAYFGKPFADEALSSAIERVLTAAQPGGG